VTERSDGAVPAGSTRRGAEHGGPRLKRRFRSDVGAEDTALEAWPGPGDSKRDDRLERSGSLAARLRGVGRGIVVASASGQPRRPGGHLENPSSPVFIDFHAFHFEHDLAVYCYSSGE